MPLAAIVDIARSSWKLRPLRRRCFLKQAAAGVTAAWLAGERSAVADESSVELSADHLRAVDRRRRITVQYDGYNALGKDWKRWLEYRFRWLDAPGVQIDSVWWDIQPLLKGYYPTPPDSLIYHWPDKQTDIANWWQQGADSVMTFNWASADREWCEEMGGEVAPLSQLAAYREVGSPATLQGKDKTFVVERRGGYPWAEGYFNRNDDSPLPKTLAADGGATTLTVRIAERIRAKADTLREVLFEAVLFGLSRRQEPN